MTTRREILRAGAVGAVGAATIALPAIRTSAQSSPGITDTSIKIGQTMPYSGPASAYGAIGKAHLAFFRMINESGGIEGRKIELLSLDDSYSPPKAVEQTRRLVEQEGVALIFGTVGTPGNSATHAYLNDHKVPQLLISTGAQKWNDPKHFPWTMGYFPSYRTESNIYGQHIAETNPKAKVGILFQNDDFGKDHVAGLKAGLKSKGVSETIVEQSYEVSEPTVDSQIVSLQGAGVDTLVIAATPKFAAQAVRKTFDLGWKATRYLVNVSISVGAVMKPAGLNKGAGIISAGWGKDPTDPRWKDAPDFKSWVAFMQKYMAGMPLNDANTVFGYGGGNLLVAILKQAGKDLSRESIMKAAANLHDVDVPMLLPGIKINTTPDNFAVVRQMQLQRFDGKSWQLFGNVMSG